MGLGIQKFTPRRHCDWLKRQSQRATHTHSHRQRDSHSHRLSERMRFSSHTAEALFSSRTNNNACRGSAAPGKTITEIVCPLCAKNQCNFRENGQKRTTQRQRECERERERERWVHIVWECSRRAPNEVAAAKKWEQSSQKLLTRQATRHEPSRAEQWTRARLCSLRCVVVVVAVVADYSVFLLNTPLNGQQLQLTRRPI